MDIDTSHLPKNVQEKLEELETEFKEGDLTEKGFNKKREQLLKPYLSTLSAVSPQSSIGDIKENVNGSSQEKSSEKVERRAARRWTKEQGNRFHSEIRQEQVMRALEIAKEKSVPLNFKRSSMIAASVPKNRAEESSDSDSDIFIADNVGQSSNSSSLRTSSLRSRDLGKDDSIYQNESILAPTGSAGSSMEPDTSSGFAQIDDVSDILDNIALNTDNQMDRSASVISSPGAHSAIFSHTHVPPSSVSDTNITDDGQSEDSSGKRSGRISQKIQQLLATLKKPKRRNLEEYFEDDDLELEIAASSLHPDAPKPEGTIISPFIVDQLSLPANAITSLEAALFQHARIFPKAPAFTVVDQNGRITPSLTYSKLLSRSLRVCYYLLNKTSQRDGTLKIKPGDRVALVFPNSDPISFVPAFYGCLMAGVIPIMIEMPSNRRDSGSQQIGFLLGSCSVKLALTSESCYKSLPRNNSNELIPLKGWPPIQWLVVTNLPKQPSSWEPPPPSRVADVSPAYIEYTCDRDGTGSVLGITVTRSSILSHSRALSEACGYADGEVMVCVVDFKREVGLWHSVLASVYSRMHVVFVPYALLKVSPGSWLLMVTKFRAAAAVVKSRDLHWGVLAQREHREVNLSQLRILVVADGANPWSLTSCDQFSNVFQCKGLRPDVICPCAASPEALTVAIRRPGGIHGTSMGRGVLSMIALSYGCIRVDNDSSLTSLTLQDCGRPLADSAVVTIRVEGLPYLCKTDEIGEICISSSHCGNSYWGLEGLSATVFKVQPLGADGAPLSDRQYVRTGLLGFMGPGGLVFVSGSKQGLLQVSGRKHSTDDIIATILAVEPMKFIFRGRIAVFAIKILRDERICVIAEQRPECTEDESFQWMSRVLQAVDTIHQVGIYCLALVLPNQLPKTAHGGVHLVETKKRFLDGTLHPCNVLMCPHTCVTNLPKPRESHPEIGPASVMVGSIVQGVRLAQTRGRELGALDDNPETGKKNQFISDMLRWRSASSPEHVLYTLLNSKGIAVAGLTCVQLHKRAERVAALLLETLDLNTGDSVALVFPPGLELICAVHACMFIGAVPVTVRPPQTRNLLSTLPTVKMIIDISRSRVVLTTGILAKLLKSKEASVAVDPRSWPPILDWEDQPKSKMSPTFKVPTGELTAYLDFSVSSTGVLAGIKMSHAATAALCRSMKLACEFYPSRHIVVSLDPYSGLGFVLWTLSSVYSGQHTILLPPAEVEANPALWVSTVSQFRVRDTYCSYGIVDTTLRGLASSIGALKERGVNLGCVRTCVIVAEERPRISATNAFTKLFSTIGLSPRAVSTSFGCRVNVAICLQGVSSPDPTSVYVDMRALRNDRVTLVERGAPHSVCLMESGKLLPGTKVVIANPDTKGQCGDSHLGEIWISSPFNSNGYYSTFAAGGDNAVANDHFTSRLITGDTKTVYARTGFLGFLRRTESIGPEGEPHDAIFVVGALDETLILRGMRFHPIDIENSVLKADKRVYECAVFSWTNLLVVVVELNGPDTEALDLVPIVTNIVLEDHQLVVGIVVIADVGTVPINSRGEKQRMHLRDSFLADQLDPIYVAYNM